MYGWQAGSWSAPAGCCTWMRAASCTRLENGERALRAQCKYEQLLHNMINVDPVELQKFSELAHRWWDPHSDFKPLHDINPLRLGYIDRMAGLKGKRVLDVGCGGGNFFRAPLGFCVRGYGHGVC